MRSRLSWLIPSKAEWKAMLWGGLYMLGCLFLLWVFVSPFLVGGFIMWVRPIVLLSQVLTDFSSVLFSPPMRILFAFVLCGMLGGLLIGRRLRRYATQRPLSGRDGWRAGASVAAWIAIPLVLLLLWTSLDLRLSRERILERATQVSGWGFAQYRQVIILCALLFLLITAIGAVLGRLLYARGIAADVEADQGSIAGMAARPGCVALLAVAFLGMYVYADVSVLLPKIPSTTPAFMRTGDFGIISQEPCGPPCFQGITPGVTTIQDAYLHLLMAGAPCRVYESRFEVSAPIREEGIRCSSDKTYIRIESPIDPGQHETDEAKVIVDSIELAPPVKATVGQLLARYGSPDRIREGMGEDQSIIWFCYDRLRTTITLPIQQAPAYTVGPDTRIESVRYDASAGCPNVMFSGVSLQSWKGYATYAPGTKP